MLSRRDRYSALCLSWTDNVSVLLPYIAARVYPERKPCAGYSYTVPCIKKLGQLFAGLLLGFIQSGFPIEYDFVPQI